jgi:hypothetical protein
MAATLAVYDPPLCCPTGVCGPSVDPALARFSADLDWLRGQGVTVERFNLAHEPAAFIRPEVQGEVARAGPGCLPLILVDGRVVSRGVYPARGALAAWVSVAPAAVSLPLNQDCCGGGSSSCC